MIRQYREIQFSMRQKRAEVPKPLKMFFLILLITFLLDFGFKSKSKKVDNALKYYVLIMTSLCAVVSVVTIVFNIHRFSDTYSYVYLALYFAIIFILLVSRHQKSVYQSLENLYIIDNELNCENIYKTEFIFLFSIVFSFTVNLILTIMAYNCTKYGIFEILIKSNISYGAHFPFFFLLLLLCSVYCRLKRLREFIENNYSNIVLFQHIYKFLIDFIEKSKEAIDYLVCCHIIHTLIVLFYFCTLVNMSLPFQIFLFLVLFIPDILRIIFYLLKIPEVRIILMSAKIF